MASNVTSYREMSPPNHTESKTSDTLNTQCERLRYTKELVRHFGTNAFFMFAGVFCFFVPLIDATEPQFIEKRPLGMHKIAKLTVQQAREALLVHGDFIVKT